MENRKTVDFYLIIVLGFSLFVNFALAIKVRKLTQLAAPAPIEHLALGTKVKSFDASAVSGKMRHLVFASTGKPVVIYVFTPTCGWCAKNLSNIKEIYRLKHTEYDFVGVSLSPNGIPEYVTQSSFPLDVVKEPSAESREKFHLNETPETIVIDNSGTVKQVWLGAYTRKTCRSIEQFFQMPDGSLNPVS